MDVGISTQAALNAYNTAKPKTKAKDAGNEADPAKTSAADKAASAKELAEAKKAYGKTVGAPKLSEAGAKYYDQLKSKFGNMDFILVSKDQVENAKKNAGAYANGQKMAVLIDEEKIEKMATDESFRKQYEGIIAMADNKIPELQKMMSGMSSVKGFGMEVGNDGNTNFFAVVKKNNDLSVQKLKEKQEAKKAKAKEDAKKADKKAAQEKLEKKRADKAEEEKRAREADDTEEMDFDPDEYEVISANSIEELMRLVEEHDFAFRSDSIRTPQEQLVGGSIDFKL